MRTTHRLILLALFAAALFVIFNCAGYLLVTLFVFTNATAPARSAADAAPQGNVVAFVTAAPAQLNDSPAGVSPAEPLPLLPTVTPGGPPPSPPPPATATPLPVRSGPAATAAPGQLDVISHKSYVDSLGWYHIVGEVQNNASTPMEYVQVTAKLYNATQETIGTKLTFTAPDVIFPGGSAPFDIIALRQSQWKNISSYALFVEGDVSQNPSRQNLVLLSQSGAVENNDLIVNGEIQNVGNTPALAKLIVTLYDADHHVINTGWSYADEGIIGVNAVSKFEIKVNHNTDPNNFHYRIQIEEEPIDTE